MNNIKRICIITDSYPTAKVPRYTFVEQLVLAWAKIGVQCTVLTPVSLTNVFIRGGELKPDKTQTVVEGKTIRIFSPRYISYTMRKMGPLNLSKLTMHSYLTCCLKYFKKHNKEFDALYGHFIPSGIIASQAGQKYDIPSFFAYGENTTYSIDYLGERRTRELLKYIDGVISVSSENKRVLTSKQIAREDQIGVFPNAVDKSVFYPRSKCQMREKFGLPQDAFIVAFVGYFVHIKGADRLSKAIDKIGSDKVKSIFIGQGEIGPSCGGVLFQGVLAHNQIGEILSAADIFVLPTLAEGCCNSIIEAMACGLPIVSSKESFNDDILDDSCSIRIDSMNVNEIADAIQKLYADKDLRDRLSKGAIIKSEVLEIDNRAKNILKFMESRMKE